ncbi:MAG: perakine reductase-like [Gammaproteobacteria bacterium]|nr:perakine reductase-like [Gammaproteobacteria bacterium]
MHLLNLRGEKIKLFPLALGLYSAGGAYQAEDRLAPDQLLPLVEAAIKMGVNYIDTAAVYGHSIGDNERCLGKVLSSLARAGKFNERNIVIGTKCGLEFSVEGARVKNSRTDIASSAQKSSLNLNVNHLGVLWLHRRDVETRVEEIAETFADLIQKGIAANVGLSEVGVETAEKFKRALAVRGLADRFVGIQGEFSIVNRHEQCLVDYCKDNNLVFFAYGTLVHGYLTDPSYAAKSFGGIRGIFFPQLTEENRQKNLIFLHKLAEFAKSKGCTVPQLCLAWAMAQGVFPLIGTTKVAHLEENLKSLQIKLTAEDLAEIEHIRVKFPVYGERGSKKLAELAPEVYSLKFLEVGQVFPDQSIC